jgi:O-antigen/teichoic acid export membrane protein
MAYSLTDQAFAAGGMFVVNVALARTQPKEDYGVFSLCYSIFTFLASLHNAAILEPFTVYGSGRYGQRFSEYSRLMLSSNGVVALALTGLLSTASLVLHWTARQYVSGALVGLSFAVGFLLTGSFLRRNFYVQRRPELAARISTVFFLTLVVGLGLSMAMHRLNGFSAFLIVAFAWTMGGISVRNRLPSLRGASAFVATVPEYWHEHWKYTRWVSLTALVFQLTGQGYYWLLAGFLSVKDVADLRALLILLAPVEQIYIAFTYLVLPALAARYAAMNIQGLVSGWKWFMLLNFGLMGTFALVIRFLGKPLVHHLYSGKFDGVAALLPTLAIIPVIMGLGNTTAVALKALEKPQMSFYAYVASGIGTLTIGLALVIHFGIRGAMYGMLLSACLYTITLGIAFATTIQQFNKNILTSA